SREGAGPRRTGALCVSEADLDRAPLAVRLQRGAERGNGGADRRHRLRGSAGEDQPCPVEPIALESQRRPMQLDGGAVDTELRQLGDQGAWTRQRLDGV